MVGVTIGINPLFKKLAETAASCFGEMTGLDVVILGEAELKDSGLKHPASLKLKAFDYVSDNNIVYFDADWFCTTKWNPLNFEDNQSITACNDFVLKTDWPDQYTKYDLRDILMYPKSSDAIYSQDDIRTDLVSEIRDFTGLTTNCLDWINTGFWIANRPFHKEWLDKSLQLYLGEIGHHEEYYEQPAMNLAVELLGLKINYLQRSYNTLVAKRKTWPFPIIGMHVKIKHHEDFVKKINDNEILFTKDIREHFKYDN